jgi:glyoxylase-like metal-dependent hydrolase (beta-lactamase superfamily II)
MTETETLKLVTDGVWFRMGERDQGHCNNVVIDVGDGLLVVDANFPSGAEALMKDIEQVTDKPVSHVFDTHHHGDHAYANAVWTRAGATTIAYVGVAEEMKRYEPAGWQAAAKARPDVAAVGADTVEPPQQTFEEVPFVLEGASRRVEFHHFGWAHTRGDGMVFLPDDGILATGDAIVNGPYNFTGHSNTGNWPNVVGQAQELMPTKILPGHGPSGGPEIAAGQHQFFEELNAAVEKAFADETPLEELVTVENGAGVSTTVELSSEVSNWVGDRFAEQVRVRYAELAEGKPHGEIVGGP